MLLGSTAESEEVGRLVVDQLCPALHAVLLDGLRPLIRSFFGRVKNSAWKVVEDSIELGKSIITVVVRNCVPERLMNSWNNLDLSYITLLLLLLRFEFDTC